jgi:hypothetical protein
VPGDNLRAKALASRIIRRHVAELFQQLLGLAITGVGCAGRRS